MEFSVKEFRQYHHICSMLERNRDILDNETLTRLEEEKAVVQQTIVTTCGRVDMRMYNNVYLYILGGLSMKEVGYQNHCDKSTVCRDIQCFFRRCEWAFCEAKDLVDNSQPRQLL